MARRIQVSTRLNGNDIDFLCEPQQSLLEVLRDELKLTGTKEGCNNGNCGACSVILNGRLVDSCCVLAAEVEGAEIMTIEGVAHNGRLHPLQQAFLVIGSKALRVKAVLDPQTIGIQQEDSGFNEPAGPETADHDISHPSIK